MEEKKKKTVLTIIAVVTLITLVASATYAYFSVGATSNFGTKVITASTEEIGAVTLNGSSTTLSMDLTAVDMMKSCTASGAASINGTQYKVSTLEKDTKNITLENVKGKCQDITYYASSEGKTTTPTEEVLGTASVSPTTDTNYYHCEYTLNITQINTGTKNMYNIFKGTQQVDGSTYTSSANEFVLTVNGVDYDLHSNTLPKQINGEFYIKGEQTKNITAGLRLVNLANKNQNLLAGSNVQISISVVNDSFKCTAEEEPEEVVAYYTYEGTNVNTRNAHKVSDYQDLNVYRRIDTNRYYVYPTSAQATCESDNGGNSCESVTQPYFIKETSRSLIAEQDIYEIQSQSSGNSGDFGILFNSLEECNDFITSHNISDGACAIKYAAGSTYNQISNEVCSNYGNTLICMKNTDWENSETLKGQFESAGLICKYNNDSTWGSTKPEEGYLQCAEQDPENEYIVGEFYCNVDSDGHADCDVISEYGCGVGPVSAYCD